VGHGGRTHLLPAETLLDFCDLAALQGAKFHAYLIQGCDRVCHPHHELGMPGPLYELGGSPSIHKKIPGIAETVKLYVGLSNQPQKNADKRGYAT
jgi:hypothetical protein